MASTDTVVGAMADGDQVPEVTVEASPPASGGDALAEYRRHKLELAELIRAVLSVAAERRDEEKQAAARDLQARLAEDSFQLAVVGQFSRGKSTLMNAILGGSYLPTGALPMTSVVTTVRYGSRPRALVQRAGSSFPIETPLDELVRFVAQASLEREELRVASAEVEVPAEILRLGFSFVDTPGIGSAIVANTATTESFLPEADAVIFVTSFDAPLSEAEVEFLVKVRRHVELRARAGRRGRR
jgi:replication fork clamp-binding protein CrfC